MANLNICPHCSQMHNVAGKCPWCDYALDFAAKKERTDGELLGVIYGIATRALSEPPDTAALVEICTMIEERSKERTEWKS